MRTSTDLQYSNISLLTMPIFELQCSETSSIMILLVKSRRRGGIWLVPAWDVHFFYALSQYMISQNGHTNITAQFYFISKSKTPVQNLLVELCTRIFFIHLLFIDTLQKACSFLFLVSPPQISIFSFLHPKRAYDLEGNICVDP